MGEGMQCYSSSRSQRAGGCRGSHAVETSAHDLTESRSQAMGTKEHKGAEGKFVASWIETGSQLLQPERCATTTTTKHLNSGQENQKGEQTSSQCLPTDDFGTLLASDCKNLHVSVGSGNSASIHVIHSAQDTGCWPLIFCTHELT